MLKTQKPDVNRYQLIPRTLIFVKYKDCVLLLKGAPDKKLWANLYNGVGGHVESGEDILSSAKRELTEETGLNDVNLHLCGIVTVDTGDSPGIGIYVFVGVSQKPSLENSSEGELNWIKSDQIKGLDMVEDLYSILPKVLTWQPGSPVFFALYQIGPGDQLRITFSN